MFWLENIRRIKLLANVAIFFLLTCSSIIHAQDGHASFASFKREMMPQVGKKITVEGVLKSGKLGWVVSYKKWEIYIYSVKSSDMSKMNAYNRFFNHMVRVTGTLRYVPAQPSANEIRTEAVPPEHFYFDVRETKVTSLKRPAPRTNKSGSENQ